MLVKLGDAQSAALQCGRPLALSGDFLLYRLRMQMSRTQAHGQASPQIRSLTEKTMANPFVHIELQTNDPSKAKDFYSKLFDWKLQDMPMPGGGDAYTMISVGEGTGGGMMKNAVPGAPSHWVAYVGVDDIRASTKKAKDLGANVVVEAMEVGDYGLMSVFIDPTGAALALWQEKKSAK
jgi:uncharacterized protein